MQTDAGVPRDGGGMVSLRIFDSHKPVIGAINGAAVGVGVTMTLPMDIRLASTAARFGLRVRPARHRARGGVELVPAARGRHQPGAGVELLRPRVRRRRSPARAASCAACTNPTTSSPAARAIAADIVENAAPVSVALTRQMMWRMLGAAAPDAGPPRRQPGDPRTGPQRRHPRGRHRLPREAFGGLHRRVSHGLPDVFPDWVEPEFE